MCVCLNACVSTNLFLLKRGIVRESNPDFPELTFDYWGYRIERFERFLVKTWPDPYFSSDQVVTSLLMKYICKRWSFENYFVQKVSQKRIGIWLYLKTTKKKKQLLCCYLCSLCDICRIILQRHILELFHENIFVSNLFSRVLTQEKYKFEPFLTDTTSVFVLLLNDRGNRIFQSTFF